MGQWIKLPHSITPRRPRFDFGQTPLHWIKDDPLASQMLNALNPLTPTPERWFCQTFREALPLVCDERLRAAALAFIKQEGAHSHGHTLVNRRIAEQGIDLSAYDTLLKQIFDDWLGPNPLGRRLNSERSRLLWLKTRLAMVAAAEHLTGVLGHWALNAQAIAAAPVDEEMWKLYQWHAAEEVVHREVADAMFRHVSGNLVLRTGAALVIFPLFVLLAAHGARHLIRQDPELPYSFRVRDYLRAARQGKVPEPEMIVRACLRYLAPNHSPLAEGSTKQALAWLEQFEIPDRHW